MLRLISELGPEAAFDPDTVQIMAAAFDRAWGTLEASGAHFRQATTPNGHVKSSPSTSFRQQGMGSEINSDCAMGRYFS
jgi:hypothetical protein